MDGRLLAIFTRYARGSTQDNAFVFGPNGEPLASFRTADAVADVQITARGDIWVSYFDESDEGQLDYFDDRGQRLFTFYPFWEEHGLPPNQDCYALNVRSDTETWAYYYDDFPLVRLVDRQLAVRWDASAIPGAHAMAVDGRQVLFAGTYDHPDSLFLLDLASGTVEEIQPVYESGGAASLARERCLGRGTRLYANDSQLLYAIDLTEIQSGRSGLLP